MQESRATDLTLRISGPGTSASAPTTVSKAWLRVPGWIRERAAELFFEDGDIDESSLAELILDSLLKAPMDLRKELASAILVSGGTAMLPGFIARLHVEILRLLEPPPSHDHDAPTSSVPHSSRGSRSNLSTPSLSFTDEPTTPRPGTTFATDTPSFPRPTKRPRPRHDPYETLRPLAPFIAILNHPSPPLLSHSLEARRNAGKAPGFAPAALAWVGASLTGALKTGTDDITREAWEDAVEEAMTPPLPLPASQTQPQAQPQQQAQGQLSVGVGGMMMKRIKVDVPGGTAHLLNDWTRPPMRQGAPSVYA